MADQDFRERVLDILSRIETQARENNARLEKRLDSLDTRVGTLERDVGWIKGKLEGKEEGSLLNLSLNLLSYPYATTQPQHEKEYGHAITFSRI